MRVADFQPNSQLVETTNLDLTDAVVVSRVLPPTVEMFREEHRADCLRIVSENYDRTMAINLDRELSEMFSNSSMPPRFFVLKQGDQVCGFGCYTTSWMQYGVFEISWINVDQ